MVYFWVGGETSIPTMIGIFVGTNALVRMAQGITSPVSGLVDEAKINLLFLYSSYYAGVS